LASQICLRFVMASIDLSVPGDVQPKHTHWCGAAGARL
jgi:hypothetical protein